VCSRAYYWSCLQHGHLVGVRTNLRPPGQQPRQSPALVTSLVLVYTANVKVSVGVRVKGSVAFVSAEGVIVRGAGVAVSQ